MTGGIIGIKNLEELVDKNKEIKNGCIVDTNVLVAASIPTDPKNEAAEALIQELARLQIPLYTNVNIRAEFLEIQRRILIPECLIEFLEDGGSNLDDIVAAQLKSVQTSYRKAIANGKLYKFNDDRIKDFRKLLMTRSNGAKSGWEIFCDAYLLKQMTTVWDDVVKTCRLNFIKIREGEEHPLLLGKVTWEGVVNLMGTYGLGSADAMIVNLFRKSKILMLASADGDILSLEHLASSEGRFLLQI